MSKQLPNIHDAFFKQALSDPLLAGTFLREHLPPDVAGLLGCEPPEPVPVSFVDEELRQHHSDLLFRVHLKTGGNALAYVLVEHKSSPERGARLQLLRYIVRILVHGYEQNEPPLPLPVVLPLLVHQGPGAWRVCCEFADLFGAVPQPLQPYLPSFRHALIDLGQMEDRELSEQARLRAFLKALKYSRRPDLPQQIDILLAEAPVLRAADLALIFTYLSKGSIAMKETQMRELLREALQYLVPGDTDLTLIELFDQVCRDKWKAEGRAVGEANILVRLIEKRFGDLPTHLRQRIFAADVATVEEWVDRVLDARDLQSVFESN